MFSFNNKYFLFISDCHFSHKKILEFERPQFKTIDDHDSFLVQKHYEWIIKIKKLQKKGYRDIVFCNLGDFFNLDYLEVYDDFPCEKIYLLGNHDKVADIPKFKQHFDYVYEYPFYISNKIVVSHVPQNVFDDQINVHGHLHGNIIDKPNYVCCSVNHIDYEPVTFHKVTSQFARLPKYTRKHLEAPYTKWEKVINRPQHDLILDQNSHIDISAMRALKFIENYEHN